MNTYELFGWLGAILILAAYYYISSGKLESGSLKFQLLNIWGAIFLVIYTYQHNAFASMVVNIIWAIIGVRSLVMISKISKSKY